MSWKALAGESRPGPFPLSQKGLIDADQWISADSRKKYELLIGKYLG